MDGDVWALDAGMLESIPEQRRPTRAAELAVISNLRLLSVPVWVIRKSGAAFDAIPWYSRVGYASAISVMRIETRQFLLISSSPLLYLLFSDLR